MESAHKERVVLGGDGLYEQTLEETFVEWYCVTRRVVALVHEEQAAVYVCNIGW